MCDKYSNIHIEVSVFPTNIKKNTSIFVFPCYYFGFGVNWSTTMGNVDTKMNFRKAIVQLGTKNQVNSNWKNEINEIKRNIFCKILKRKRNKNNNSPSLSLYRQQQKVIDFFYHEKRTSSNETAWITKCSILIRMLCFSPWIIFFRAEEMWNISKANWIWFLYMLATNMQPYC